MPQRWKDKPETPFPRLPNINLADVRDYKLADIFVERIEEWVKSLQKKLKPDEDLRLTVILNNGQEILIDFIGYYNPNLVAFEGFNITFKKKCTVLVHQNNTQLLCTIEKKPANEKRREIGFLADM